MQTLVAQTTTEPIADFAPPSIASHRTSAWGAIVADNVDVVRLEPFDYTYQGSRHLLMASERAERYDGETLVDGLPRSHQRAWNGKMTFVPAGCRFYGWQKPRALARVTFLYIDPRSPLLQAQLGLDAAELKPRLFFFDHDLWQTALKLKAQVDNPVAPGAYVEALGIALAYELMRVNESVPAAVSRTRGGLPGWQQNRLAQYIEENLAQEISLAALAGLAQLSPYHLCRAFKQSFGMPPHRYLTGRRVERAKSLLSERKLSVTEIALEVGFATTSAFIAVFRRTTGQTPTEYRRALG